MTEKYIQIIGYRQGHDKNSGKPYVWQKHFDSIQVTSIVKLFENINDIVNLIPEDERFDVHYTNANCYQPTKDKTVPLRLFAYQEMIPIDLDGIDLLRKDEYIKIVCDVLRIDKSKTAITCSGHGLHFVIALTQRIETAKELHRLQKYYKALCSKLNVEFFNNGLVGEADPVRLAESATLRLPLTFNMKELHNPIKAYIIQGNLEPQPFYLDKIVDIQEEEEVEQSLRAVDTKAVLSGCNFLKNCLANSENVSEPEWYAMLGVLSYIPDTGINLCHTYSQRHKDYDFDNTQTKAEQALGFGKPRTCQSIHQVYPGCVSCPHFKKIRTPLVIKSDEFIATETTGFHTVANDANGMPTKFVPNYEDLLKFFKKKNNYVVNKKNREVFVFNGKYWTQFLETEIDNFSTISFNPVANNNKRSEFKGLLLSTNVVDADFFGSSNTGYINFNNGVLRIEDRKLLPHSPDYGFQYVLPYDYNPHAKAPEFQKMLDNVTLNDKTLQTLLLEYIGYAISGKRASMGSKALILTGGGSNGKSTFLNIVKMLIGKDCYSAVSLTDMKDANARYSMVGKLFNICEEEEEDALKNGTAMFKSITTGADVLVKKLYSDTVPMRIDTKLIISCNDLPSSRENTYAIYRRMLIVPFKAKFSKSTGLDKHIEERVELEMSGVYNMVLDAFDNLVKNNYMFTEAEAAVKALEEYKYNNSFYNQFADSCLATGAKEDFVTNEELIFMFNTWAEANNVRLRPTNPKLIKELKMIGALPQDTMIKKVNNTTKRVYTGVRKLNTGAF